ncbi:hypothetical protein P7C73_g1301, partial [Tremellales sp. Uapishka_1]
MSQATDSISVSGAADQQLLQKLIKEGLTTSQEGIDIPQFRTLLVVLFQACILNVVDRLQPLSPIEFDNASYTLAIFTRQISSTPLLLLSLPPETDPPLALYKWVMPRLVYAASKLDGIDGTDKLVKDLAGLPMTILQVLARDVVDEETTYMQGPKRVASLLKDMLSACQEGKPASLCGDLETPSGPLPLLLTLNILLGSSSPFSGNITSAAGPLLARAYAKIKPSNTRHQLWYLWIVTSAISSIKHRHGLAKACIHLVKLPTGSTDTKWQDGMSAFFSTLSKSDETVRCLVWWAVFEKIDQLSAGNRIDYGAIVYLLTPIAPRLAATTIKALLTPEVVARWTVETGADGRPRSEIQILYEGLGNAESNSTPISKKRRRSHEGERMALELLKERLPESSATDELDQDVLLTLKAISATELLTPLFCTIAGCGNHHHLTDRILPDAYLDIWLDIEKKTNGGQLRTMMRSLANLFDHMTLFDISTGMQLSSRRTILEKIWDGLIAPSRLTRVSAGVPFRSLAFTELLGIARHRGKTPYNLISPFVDQISVFLALNLVKSPDMVLESMQFIGYKRRDFFEIHERKIIPALVLARDRMALESVSRILQKPLGKIIIDIIHLIISAIYLHPSQTQSSMTFLLDLLKSLTRGQGEREVSIASLITSCIVPLIVALVVELGDEDRKVAQVATNALLAVQKEQNSDSNGGDLGAFLKPNMLGVMSHMNDMLHDVQGKKSVSAKRKVIRSLGSLIQLIMASLQSTLGIGELREETLRTWRLFVDTLKYSDVGPFVGPTTAALVQNWKMFTEAETVLAIGIVDDIANNSQHLEKFVDDIVGLDRIPQLKYAHKKLFDKRERLSTTRIIDKMLERTRSKNVAVSTTAMREVRVLLATHHKDISQFCQGDAFDPLIARIVKNLLYAAQRDGDCQELRDLSYECMGVIGALDPDRFTSLQEDESMTILHNFGDYDEASDFALHLIKDVLVGAFRATNDTKHQGHLAYAIQELLKYCQFTPKLLNPSFASIPKSIRAKWQSLPKDLLETLTPLLEARFSVGESRPTEVQHPIYPGAPTYREWIQIWTTDLVAKIMSLSPNDRNIKVSQTIFGVLRGVLKIQDVTVAHHILPHLVLHVLQSGPEGTKDEICGEINAVLQDQVNPSGSADKRMLSAQVIFDLVDHLSKWLRLRRVGNADKGERGSKTKLVEGVISSIETELTAHAALQSKAYARSLRNFEQRIVQLRKEKREDSELQTYFERLHQIYAELDEPDGMEGVSAFVISPTLEHQIREHESTGRWTSAQSCWEVKLQQNPEDVTLHVGLLKCLRNLGHYGECCTMCGSDISDTLRTHILGVLSRRPMWEEQMAPFRAEAAWMIGDWETVSQIPNGPPIARVLLAMHDKSDLEPALRIARRDLGKTITTTQYSRAYDTILQIHMINELEMIHKAGQSKLDQINGLRLARHAVDDLTSNLNLRFETTSSAFRVREAMLSIRRTAFGLVDSPLLKNEIGKAWITSSKIARKAGFEQTAYGATLQAKEVDAPFAFLQEAKLVKAHGGALKALTDLENNVKPLLRHSEKNVSNIIDLTMDEGVKGEEGFSLDRNLAKVSQTFQRKLTEKAVLLEARWAQETGRFERNEILERFRNAINLAANVESPYYHLGHYYDTMERSPEEE